MVNKEIIEMHNALMDLGFFSLESLYCIKKAYSCWGRISKKRQNLYFLVFDTFESSLPEIKKEKIKKMFPEVDLIHKMYELEFPRKDIKRYLDDFDDPILRELILKPALENIAYLELRGKGAVYGVDKQLNKSKLRVAQLIFSEDNVSSI